MKNRRIIIKLGIYIPNYNGAKTIKRAIDSVLIQQKFDGLNIKITVVDNNSSDDSLKLLKAYINYPYFRVITYSETISIAKNWNRCLSIFRQGDEDYLLILSVDDYLLPDFLITWHGYLLKAEYAVYLSSVIFNDEIKQRKFECKIFDKDSVIIDSKFLLLGNLIYVCSAIINRRTVMNFNFHDEYQQLFDWFFWLNIFSKSDYKGFYLNRPLAVYCKHSENLTAKNKQSGIIEKEEISIMSQYLEYFPEIKSKMLLKLLKSAYFSKDEINFMKYYPQLQKQLKLENFSFKIRMRMFINYYIKNIFKLIYGKLIL